MDVVICVKVLSQEKDFYYCRTWLAYNHGLQTSHESYLEPMQRVLIVKTTSMGDVIHTMPVVADLKRAFPACQIDWMVEAPFADLVQLNADVSHVVPVALRAWRKQGWGEVLRQRSHLREKLALTPYDAVIDLQGLLKSVFLAKSAKGPFMGGTFRSTKESLACFFYDRRGGCDLDAHAVERLRQIVANLFNYALEGAPDFGLKQYRHATSQQSDHRGAPCVWFLHATARSEKSWPIQNWKGLARRYTDEGMQVFLPWGTEAERLQAENIAKGLPKVTVLPKMSLSVLCQRMASAQLVVGVDTGLTHLAAALYLPMVALYFATPQWRYAPLFNPEAINLGDVGLVPSLDEVYEAGHRLLRQHMVSV